MWKGHLEQHVARGVPALSGHELPIVVMMMVVIVVMVMVWAKEDSDRLGGGRKGQEWNSHKG